MRRSSAATSRVRARRARNRRNAPLARVWGMSKLKVLFIGGTGVISSACVREAVGGDHDVELFVLNRGQSPRFLPPGVTQLRGDVREAESVRKAVAGLDFDSVVDFVA